MTTPPLSFFVRGPDGLSLLVGPPFHGEPAVQLLKIPCVAAVFSNDGSMLAVTSENALNIYDTRDGSIIQSLKVAGIKAAAFSPKGTFLQTFEPPTQSQKNVTIWNVATGVAVFQQSQKTFSKAAWPTIQFSEDESVACRTVTNEVHFFDPKDFSRGILERLRVPGIDKAQLATSPPTHVAAYVPEIKEQFSLPRFPQSGEAEPAAVDSSMPLRGMTGSELDGAVTLPHLTDVALANLEKVNGHHVLIDHSMQLESHLNPHSVQINSSEVEKTAYSVDSAEPLVVEKHMGVQAREVSAVDSTYVEAQRIQRKLADDHGLFAGSTKFVTVNQLGRGENSIHHEIPLKIIHSDLPQPTHMQFTDLKPLSGSTKFVNVNQLGRGENGIHHEIPLETIHSDFLQPAHMQVSDLKPISGSTKFVTVNQLGGGENGIHQEIPAETIHSDLPQPTHMQVTDLKPLSDAPITGAPIRLFRFVARYVSGADLVK